MTQVENVPLTERRQSRLLGALTVTLRETTITGIRQAYRADKTIDGSSPNRLLVTSGEPVVEMLLPTSAIDHVRMFARGPGLIVGDENGIVVHFDTFKPPFVTAKAAFVFS